jgi:hypothetical protein
MEISKPIEVMRFEEIKILNDVRLIHSHDLNHRDSRDNLTAQFELSGELKGFITCYLCLDEKEIGHTDRNYLFPLFIEAMNILIGKQISLDPQLTNLKITMSTPKIKLNPTSINTKGRFSTHLYELQLDDISYDVLVQYSLQMVN